MRSIVFSVLLLLGAAFGIRADDESGSRILELVRCDTCLESSGLTALSGLPTTQIDVRSRRLDGTCVLIRGMLSRKLLEPGSDLRSVQIPSWLQPARLSSLRFFKHRVVARREEIDLLGIGENAIYVLGIDSLFFYESKRWFALAGSRSIPCGAIEVISDPAGASVVLDGQQTVLRTPVIIQGLPAASHTIEVHRDEYRFARRSAMVVDKAVSRLSFTLVSDLDTVFIRDNAGKSLLVLAQPPNARPLIVDQDTAGGSTVKVDAGQHRIRWNGGDAWLTTDTFIWVPPDQIWYLDLPFKRRHGGLMLAVFPFDAQVWINDSSVGEASDNVYSLPTGRYDVRVRSRGYLTCDTTIIVLPDTIVECLLPLKRRSDLDGDGFLDSADLCPEIYGLYDGCPSPNPLRALQRVSRRALDTLERDPFTVGVVIVGYVDKIALNPTFRSLIGRFDNGGLGGGFNNYRGLVIGNTYSCSWKGVVVSCELGQWMSGLSYRYPDTLVLEGSRNRYLVYCDTLSLLNGTANRTEPRIFIKSTAPSLGIRLPIKGITSIYSIGYQWEDIVFDDLRDAATGARTRVSIDNDWWFHGLRVEGDVRFDQHIVPSLFLDFRMALGHSKHVRWITTQIGLMLKIKRDPPVSSTRGGDK